MLPPNQGSTQLALPDMWFKLWDLCNGIHLHGTYQLLDPNSKPQPETAVPSLWMMLFWGMPRRPGTHRGVARCDLRLSLHHLVRRRDQGRSEVFEGGKGSWDPTGVSASVSRWNVGRFRPCWIWPGFILTGGCGLGLTKCLEKNIFENDAFTRPNGAFSRPNGAFSRPAKMISFSHTLKTMILCNFSGKVHVFSHVLHHSHQIRWKFGLGAASHWIGVLQLLLITNKTIDSDERIQSCADPT